MEQQINELKVTFQKIVELKNENDKKMAMLDSKTKHLKNIYSDFIKINNEILCVFSLDSLHFQAKIIDIEYDDMKRLFSSILNRMYCDFFKLYKIITEYINTNINDKKVKEMININNQYPIYKDLEPFKVYEFTSIENIHDVILEFMRSLINLNTQKESELKKYQSKNKFGFNIDNFVNTIMFNNIMLREKIHLFINYLSFFHKLQIKYLSRYINKLDLLISQLDSDINFEERQDSSEESDVIIEKEYTSKNLIENVICDDSGEKYEMPVYEVEYNSDMSSLDGTTTIDVVENHTEISNSKRKKYLAKKKRLQQKKLENKKALEEKIPEDNIQIVVGENVVNTDTNSDVL